MHYGIFLLSLLSFPFLSTAQSYSHWIIGDTSDYTTAQPQGGLLLAGGGGDNDDAMSWLLQRADGGDVVVLRESGTDGYNSYLFTDLGVSLNSVETIRFNQAAAAHDSYVLRRVQEAELIFIAGGDQRIYELYWKDTPLETLINQKVHGPNAISLGGSSAGMAILGDYYYSPQNLGINSNEALSDPYHNNMDSIQAGDLFQHPQALHSLFDTHFDDRNRAGRFLAMMARVQQDYGEQQLIGIACNEYTAVAVDTAGQYRVFGDAANYPDYAYFAYDICGYTPSQYPPGQALDWSPPIRVLRISGRPNPQVSMQRNGQTLALSSSYTDSLDIQWWSAQQNVLQKESQGSCLVQSTSTAGRPVLQLYPNPTQAYLDLRANEEIERLQLYDVLGREVWQSSFAGQKQLRLDLPPLKAGVYFLKMNSRPQSWSLQILP